MPGAVISVNHAESTLQVLDEGGPEAKRRREVPQPARILYEWPLGHVTPKWPHERVIEDSSEDHPEDILENSSDDLYYEEYIRVKENPSPIESLVTVMTSELKGPVRGTPEYINIYNAYLTKLLGEKMFPALPPPHPQGPDNCPAASADSEIYYD